MRVLTVTFRVEDISSGSQWIAASSLQITLLPLNHTKLVWKWEDWSHKASVHFTIPDFLPEVPEQYFAMDFHLIHRSTGEIVAVARIDTTQFAFDTPMSVTIEDQVEGALGVYVSVTEELPLPQGIDRFTPACLSAMTKINRKLKHNGVPGLEKLLRRFHDPGRQGCVSRSELVNALSAHLDLELPHKLLDAFIADANKYAENPPKRVKERLEDGTWLWYPGVDSLIEEPERIQTLKKRLRRLFQEAKAQGLQPKRTFRHFDPQNKGVISRKDLHKGLRQLGFDLTVKEVIVLMGELTDGETVALSDLVAFTNDTDDDIRPVSPLWSPTGGESPTEVDIKTAQDVPVVDDFPTRELQVRNAELENLLEQAKLRISHLEEICARSQKDLMMVQKPKTVTHEVIGETERKSGQTLVQEAQEILAREFSPNRVKQHPCIEAHVALELALEKEIEELKAALSVLKKKHLAEKRAATRLRNQLDMLFSTTSAGRQAIVRATLGQHLIRLCRDLCEESYDLLAELRRKGRPWAETSDLNVDVGALIGLQQAFHKLEWTDAAMVDDQGRVSVQESLNAMEAFLAWEIQEEKLSKEKIEAKHDDYSFDWISSSNFLRLRTLALRCGSGSSAQADATAWFPEEASTSADYFLDYKELNECIFNATNVAFEDISELKQCLEYFHSKQWISTPSWEQFLDKRTINVAEFCNALERLALEELPLALPQVGRVEEQKLDPRAEREEMQELVFKADIEFGKFAEGEHSSCWAPLSRFGRVPFECVRLLDGSSSAEYNTTSSRSIMAFIEGEIMDDGQRVAVSLVKNKSIGKGSWALCVTSSPPMNRPAKGSCIYNSIAGDTNAVAYVQGTSGTPVESTHLRVSMISSKEARLAFQHIQGSGLESVLVGLYCRFFEDASVLRREVRDYLQSLGPGISPNTLTLHEFSNLLRRFETELRFHVDTMLQHLKDQEKLLKKDLRRAGIKSMKSAKERSEFVRVVADSLDTFRGYLFPEDWLCVLKHELVAATRSSTTYSSFSLDGVVKELIKQLIVHFSVERLKFHTGESSVSTTKAIGIGDTLTAVVYNGSVSYVVNDVLQAQLKPTCPRPWRFAWFATSSASASVTRIST